jgi:NAD(P)-dependent dehydrogenase (short-subunit alcohol dehydrogenase family)
MTALSRYAGLEGRVALVTGAAGGLGSAIVKQYVSQGVSVVACDRDDESLSPLASELGPDDPVHFCAVDLADTSVGELLVEATVAAFGRIDILVNNAAVLHRMPLEEVSSEVFDEIMAVNLRAPFLLSRAALREMRQQRSGRIINVSSIAARTGGSSDVFPYAASKGGLVALTKAFAKVAGRDNVLVSAVLPAAIDTPMISDGFEQHTLDSITGEIPLGRLSQPSEIAQAVLWLSSDAASYVNGASIDVNGGWVMT